MTTSIPSPEALAALDRKDLRGWAAYWTDLAAIALGFAVDHEDAGEHDLAALDMQRAKDRMRIARAYRDAYEERVLSEVSR